MHACMNAWMRQGVLSNSCSGWGCSELLERIDADDLLSFL